MSFRTMDRRKVNRGEPLGKNLKGISVRTHTTLRPEETFLMNNYNVLPREGKYLIYEKLLCSMDVQLLLQTVFSRLRTISEVQLKHILLKKYRQI